MPKLIPTLKSLRERLANQVASRWANEVNWTFDSPEAVGVVQVVKGPYGAWLNFPEPFGFYESVALVDLFYRSPEGTNGGGPGPYIIQLHSQEEIGEDPVHTQFYHRCDCGSGFLEPVRGRLRCTDCDRLYHVGRCECGYEALIPVTGAGGPTQCPRCHVPLRVNQRWVRVERTVTIPPSIVNPQPVEKTFFSWHTVKCLADDEQWRKERDEYVARWPNHCTHCQGAGGFAVSYDPSPAGVSLSPGSMEDFDPCPECVEPDCMSEAKCARCGLRFIDGLPQTFRDEDIDDETLVVSWIEQQAPCPNCNWNWGRDPTDYIPPRPECGCPWQSDPPAPHRGALRRGHLRRAARSTVQVAGDPQGGSLWER